MAEETINIHAVIEQLMTRIAQLELEVAVLKSFNPGHLDIPPSGTGPPIPGSFGGYM